MLTTEVVEIASGLIDVRPGGQDRGRFDGRELEELAASISENGLAQPPTVRPVGSRFELVAGERRTRAMRLLGWESIPCLVRALEAASRIMLIENVQRVDLDPLEEAQAYAERIDRFGWSAAECARMTGISADRVRSRLSLLKLAEDVQVYLRTRCLPLGHAACMVNLDNNRQRIALIAFNDRGLSLVAFKSLCAKLLADQEDESAESMFELETYQVRASSLIDEAVAMMENPAGDPAQWEPVGIVEIAQRLGVARATVDQWQQRKLLPAPRWTVGGRPCWDLGEILAWAQATGRGNK